MHKEFDTDSSENEEARVAKRKRVQSRKALDSECEQRISDDETERIFEPRPTNMFVDAALAADIEAIAKKSREKASRKAKKDEKKNGGPTITVQNGGPRTI